MAPAGPRKRRSEFTATAVPEWLGRVGVKAAFIKPVRRSIGPLDRCLVLLTPWENGCNESFNGKLHDELLSREVFYTLAEARVLLGAWRRHHDTIRPHSSLGYRPPAPEVISPQQTSTPWMPSGSATLHLPSPMAQEGPMP